MKAGFLAKILLIIVFWFGLSSFSKFILEVSDVDIVFEDLIFFSLVKGSMLFLRKNSSIIFNISA